MSRPSEPAKHVLRTVQEGGWLRFFVTVSYTNKRGKVIKFSKTVKAKDWEDAMITTEVITRRRKSFAGKLEMLIRPMQ
jgi:hypothetical protein